MSELLLVAGLFLSPLIVLGTLFLLRRPLSAAGRASWRPTFAALAGGAVCVFVIIVTTPEPVLGVHWVSDFELGVWIPLTEEGLKAVVVAAVCAVCASDEVDGAYFGALVGVGFALVENHYFFMRAPDVDILLMLYGTRTFLATTGHALTTGLVGAAVGWWFAERTWPRTAAVAFAFGVAAALHGLHNVYGPAHSESGFIPFALLQLAAFTAAVVAVFRRNRAAD